MEAYCSDDGATWSGGLLLDAREQISYPDGDQAEDGTIYLTHDHERRGAREILTAAGRNIIRTIGEGGAE